jgi:hypothetical protein
VGALLTVPVLPARLNSQSARSVPISVTLLAHERVAPGSASIHGTLARTVASLTAERRRLTTFATGALAALPRAISAAVSIAPGGGGPEGASAQNDAVAGSLLAAASAARPPVGSVAAYTAVRSAFAFAARPGAFAALSGVVAAQEAARAALEEARRARAEARRERAEARRERAEARRERLERLQRQHEREERQRERAERQHEAERRARAAERRERAAERRERDRDRRPASRGAWNVAPVVTWYGPGFYGNRTACGQRYTKSIIGVAHKTLPCGTLVQFSWHGITATAPVIDRGPYGPPGYEFDFSARLSCDIFGSGGKGSCITRTNVLWRVVRYR